MHYFMGIIPGDDVGEVGVLKTQTAQALWEQRTGTYIFSGIR